MQPSQRNCETCGSPFQVTRVHGYVKRYCTSLCRHQATVARRVLESGKDGKDYLKDKHRRYKYGLTDLQFQSLLNSQGGVCAVCSLPITGRLSVDHDHKCCPGSKTCGECVRGILHHTCNAALGSFYDSPEVLRKAAVYLERTRCINPSK